MEISISKNKSKRLQLKPVKMTCDYSINLIHPPLEPYHFFYVFCGKPASGKSSLMFSLINSPNKGYWKCFHDVHIFSPSLSTLGVKFKSKKFKLHSMLYEDELEELLTNVKERYENSKEMKNEFNELETKKEKEEFIKENGVFPEIFETLFIFDDFIMQLKGCMSSLTKLAYNRRHYGTSLMLSTQKFNEINAKLRPAISSLFLWRTNIDLERKTIHREIFGNMSYDEFCYLMDALLTSQHDFMLFNVYKQELYDTSFGKVKWKKLK